MDEPEQPRKIWKFVKYGIVGFTGFVINSVFLELFSHAAFLGLFLGSLKNLGIVPFLLNQSAWAAGLATELAIISNFILNNAWTFNNQKAVRGVALFLKFLQFNAISCGAIVIQFVMVGLGTSFLGHSLLVRQASLATAIVFLVTPYNWLMYNKIVWKKQDEKTQ